MRCPRRIATALACLVLVATNTACGNDEADATRGPSTPTVRVEPGIAAAESVQDYFARFDATHLNGIDLPVIATTRVRASTEVEGRFVDAVRGDPSTEEAAGSLSVLDDEALVYLGYLFCGAHDMVDDPAPAVTAVVDVVARAVGHDPTRPATADYIVSVIVVNHASGSLCGEFYVPTRAFLDELLATG